MRLAGDRRAVPGARLDKARTIAALNDPHRLRSLPDLARELGVHVRQWQLGSRPGQRLVVRYRIFNQPRDHQQQEQERQHRGRPDLDSSASSPVRLFKIVHQIEDLVGRSPQLADDRAFGRIVLTLERASRLVDVPETLRDLLALGICDPKDASAVGRLFVQVSASWLTISGRERLKRKWLGPSRGPWRHS